MKDLELENLEFETEDMKISPDGGLSLQYLNKISENIGYVYANRTMKISFENYKLEPEITYIFDSGKNWNLEYIAIFLKPSSTPIVLPYTFDLNSFILRFMRLSFSYQDLLSSGSSVKISARLLNLGGGLQIRNFSTSSVYLAGFIAKMLKV